MPVYLSHFCFFVSDAAFLAREKAKADAEFYTAAKFAEANRVKRPKQFKHFVVNIKCSYHKSYSFKTVTLC